MANEKREKPADVPDVVWGADGKSRERQFDPVATGTTGEQTKTERPVYTSRPQPEPVAPIEDISKPHGGAQYTSDGSMRSREPHRDFFSLNKAQEAAVGDGYTPTWVRDPKIWKSHELVDRVEEITRLYDGAEQVLIDGKEQRLGPDLVLMKIPKVLTDQRQAETDAAQRERIADMFESEEVEGALESHTSLLLGTDQPFDRRDRETLDRRARQQHAQHVRMGIVGDASPTHGMSLPEARIRMGPERMARDEEMYRTMGMHKEGDAVASFQETLTRKIEQFSPKPRGGKSFAVGADLGATTRERVQARGHR